MKEKEKRNQEIKILKENSSEFDNKKAQFESIFSFSKSRLLSKLLNSFSKKEKNKYFDEMSSDLINFRIEQEKNDNIGNKISNEISFKNILYSFLEKNLIEIIYIRKENFRNERIAKLYNWYEEQLNRFKDIKFIDKKSYNDPGSMDDEEYFKKKYEKLLKENEYLTEDKILKEQMSHRTQGPFDKKMLNEYKRVHVYDNPYYKKINKNKNINKEIEKQIKNINSPVLNKNISPPQPIINRPVGDSSTFYSSFNGTNSFSLRKTYDSNFSEKPEGGEKERTFYTSFIHGKKYASPEINKDIKFSYSFNRPPADFNILRAEKTISENKNKLISEKRAKEELDKNVEKFAIDRARFKENILKKNEIKDIINMYIKTKNIKYQLLKRSKSKTKTDFSSNKNKTFIKALKPPIMTEKERASFPHNIARSPDANDYNINAYLKSEKNIKQIKKEKDVMNNNKNNFYNSPKMRKKDLNQNQNRMMKRHLTLGDLQISKQFRRMGMGNKIIIDEIKNINKITNEIMDNSFEKINTFNIKLKYKKDSIKQKLLKMKINSENDNSKTPNDIVYKLISEKSLFKQKLLSDNLCNITARMNDKRFIKEPLSEDESIYHNFCLSAYNWKNMKIINRNRNNIEKDVNILRHISPYGKTIRRKKLVDESDSFNNYRNDYLNLRKTIGEWKKYEYEKLLNKINTNNKIEGKDEENLNININKEKSSKNNNDFFINKINNIKFKKQKVLINAIMNPNEDNNFPNYFLPKTGENLLSKIDSNIPKKKKNKK